MGKWKMSNILKIANRTARRRQNWDSLVQVEQIWDIFDLIAFKAILGHSVHFLKIDIK